MPVYVPPELNNPHPGAVLIVGRDPGEDEEAAGRPFVGRAGELLDAVMTEGGWRRQDVNIANTVPYRPPNNDFGQHIYEDVNKGVKALQALVARLRPSLVIALGNEANFALVDGWPTGGRGIHGAKSIEERRGYFWNQGDYQVLSALHPAAVLRKEVPGRYLLETDFRRAKKFITGWLPFESFPEVRHLGPQSVASLLKTQLIGWDIETKWESTALLCSGYCGDDYQPYVALARGFDAYGRALLEDPVPKVGHNGFGFDVPALRHLLNVKVNGYNHDTQLMWAALEPEIAGTDEAGGDEHEEQRGERRLTRKGLAFLMTMYDFNFPWWKNYPHHSSPTYVDEMFVLNGRDAFATRYLASTMLQEIRQRDILPQYQQKLGLIPVLARIHTRGMPINEALRLERITLLTARREAGEAQSKLAAMSFITANSLDTFSKLMKCACCGGGKMQAQYCWRCGKLPIRPKRKGDWPAAYVSAVGKLYDVSKPTVGDLRKALPKCSTCDGTGKRRSYDYKPFSPQQQMQLLVHYLGAPKHTFKGKDKMDETALKRILRWANS